ncbi:hypothetical protein PIB30_038155 [Stylosanthes scabra]|uniref:DUF4408 domain-containing protein n=1 Tax=Stylosanthes scabra TaxID=79078 RepID=A0ABU6WF70_9FABA|nr:hypothetical protein [Stylosanthes scabra]
MDSFSFHNLQAEKANAILKNRKLRRITGMLRFLEVCVVLVLISRLSLRLPIAVKNSGEYFRDLSVFVNSPRFVFFVGNAIIITLFAQSGQFSGQGSRRNDSEEDLYHEFLENATKKQRTQENLKNRARAKQGIETEETVENIKNQEKEGIKTEDSIIKNKRISRNMVKQEENSGILKRKEANFGLRSKGIDAGGKNKCDVEKQNMETGEVNNCLEVKKYRRCQTEILHRRNRGGDLRRCETEKRIKAIEHGPTKEEEEEGGGSYPEDNMSNEEFRRTIEAFIARQQRIRREEEDYSLA